MSKGVYIGVNNVARKIKKIYIGVGGGARKVKKAYIGVNNVARLFWSGSNFGTLFSIIQDVNGTVNVIDLNTGALQNTYTISIPSGVTNYALIGYPSRLACTYSGGSITYEPNSSAMLSHVTYSSTYIPFYSNGDQAIASLDSYTHQKSYRRLDVVSGVWQPSQKISFQVSNSYGWTISGNTDNRNIGWIRRNSNGFIANGSQYDFMTAALTSGAPALPDMPTSSADPLVTPLLYKNDFYNINHKRQWNYAILNKYSYPSMSKINQVTANVNILYAVISFE